MWFFRRIHKGFQRLRTFRGVVGHHHGTLAIPGVAPMAIALR
ncbi:Uncharacterized protein PPKH_2344 [Pseudomonas putida]|nr:Uncharacterized protein PPKH_2344 [Pseudomonas putida]